MEFKWPARVYIEDTDAGGIVYYVNYLKFMERARTEFLRHLGFDHAEMIKQGTMFVIHSTEIHYREPACLDDELVVSVVIDEIKRTHLTFRQQIFRGATRITEAKIKGACVRKNTMKPCVIPIPLAEALQAYIGEQ
ncbi:MAG: tol-pal system-associated acyl-CoA thioesterase [Pseudomonadales bacterium]|nr:tol-pal system-associated acyl-CoA thioesterase [Pseudomonadales bacterium]MCP5215317.1 tol-pal system-associated acyl-CoA thioesterase [Pseudomonadales bacterium]